MALLENISRKQSLNLVWFDKRKEIEITHDQEFDEIEGRIQKEEERIERYAKDRINLDKRPK